MVSAHQRLLGHITDEDGSRPSCSGHLAKICTSASTPAVSVWQGLLWRLWRNRPNPCPRKVNTYTQQRSETRGCHSHPTHGEMETDTGGRGHCTMRSVLFSSLHICETTSRERAPDCHFSSSTRRGLISHIVRAHGFYDPVQRAVITNECPWCPSIFSTRLDAQHHACSSFLQGFLPRSRKPKTNRNQAGHCCLLCARCVKLKKSRIKNLSHRLFHMLNLFRCSFHLCPTIRTTSSGAIYLYLESRERGLQKLHSFVAPTMFPRRDLLRLAMRPD